MDALKFWDEFDFLSNFYSVKVYYEDIDYPTVEHAYQAAKTLDIKERRKIRNAAGPGVAKKIGQTVKIRDDWEDVKIGIMDDLVRQKFERQSLRNKLLEIDGQIVEGNFWGDTFWGVCKGKGRNELGKILMKIRDEINGNYIAIGA